MATETSATLAIELGELAFKQPPDSCSIFNQAVDSIKDDDNFILFLSPWIRYGWLPYGMFVAIFRRRTLRLCLTVLARVDFDLLDVAARHVLFPSVIQVVKHRREKLEWLFTRWQINCLDPPLSLWQHAFEQNDREGLEAMLPFHPLFPLFLVGITTKSASATIPTDLLWEVFDMM